MVELPVVRSMTLAAPVITQAVTAASSVGAERAGEPAIGGAGAVEGVGVDGRDAAVVETLAPAARS